jgi:hypothetical protein
MSEDFFKKLAEFCKRYIFENLNPETTALVKNEVDVPFLHFGLKAGTIVSGVHLNFFAK